MPRPSSARRCGASSIRRPTRPRRRQRTRRWRRISVGSRSPTSGFARRATPAGSPTAARYTSRSVTRTTCSISTRMPRVPACAAREPRLNATFIVEGATAERHARRYDRARSLLVGRPWLEDYAGGEALAVLAEAEARLGLATSAGHYAAARARATGVRAALLAVREGLAGEVAGERDSAAAAYAAARGAGLASVDPWPAVRP